MSTMRPYERASVPMSQPGRGGFAAASGSGLMPLVGLMVRPFPEPGPMVRSAMERLQLATTAPPADEDADREFVELPRPWDPGTCTGQMRTELWAWLDLVARWINEQHLWTVTRPGIPECWPAHPHLVHDLAVVACSRYYTRFALTPAALEDWHRYGLPQFLERLRDRLGDGCHPGTHQPRPRHERDQSHASAPARRCRKQRYGDDVDRAGETSAVTNPDHNDRDSDEDNENLHERW